MVFFNYRLNLPLAAGGGSDVSQSAAYAVDGYDTVASDLFCAEIRRSADGQDMRHNPASNTYQRKHPLHHDRLHLRYHPINKLHDLVIEGNH